MMRNKHIKRTNLLDHGVSLLMTQGYHATGVKEIVDAVQVPKGSFYSYFESKEAFAVEAITHYMEPYIQRLTEHLQDPQIDALTALNVITQITLLR